MKEVISIAKALSDGNRVRALMFLKPGELCVCQIIEMLALAPSTVSKHMSILYEAGLVEKRKVGRWNYYRLPGSRASKAARSALTWVQNSLIGNADIIRDRASLKTTLKKEKEECCVHYR